MCKSNLLKKLGLCVLSAALCSAAFASCGKDGGDDAGKINENTDISAVETEKLADEAAWKAAFDLTKYTNFSMKTNQKDTIGAETAEESLVYMFAGDKVYYSDRTKDKDGKTRRYDVYLAKTNDVWSAYGIDYADGEKQHEGAYDMNNSGEYEYMMSGGVGTMTISQLGEIPFADVSYSEEKKAYIYTVEGQGDALLKFANGLFAGYTMSAENGEGEEKIVRNLSVLFYNIGSTVVTLPEKMSAGGNQGGGNQGGDEHQHHYDDSVWESDSDGHWHKCDGANCSETTAKENHEWDGGKVTVAATPVRSGEMTYTCEVCGYERNESFDYASIKSEKISKEAYIEEMSAIERAQSELCKWYTQVDITETHVGSDGSSSVKEHNGVNIVWKRNARYASGVYAEPLLYSTEYLSNGGFLGVAEIEKTDGAYIITIEYGEENEQWIIGADGYVAYFYMRYEGEEITASFDNYSGETSEPASDEMVGTSLNIVKKPKKLSYVVGEKLNPAGIEISYAAESETGSSSSGSSTNPDDFNFLIGKEDALNYEFTAEDAANKTVVVNVMHKKYRGIVETFEVQVFENASDIKLDINGDTVFADIVSEKLADEAAWKEAIDFSGYQSYTLKNITKQVAVNGKSQAESVTNYKFTSEKVEYLASAEMTGENEKSTSQMNMYFVKVNQKWNGYNLSYDEKGEFDSIEVLDEETMNEAQEVYAEQGELGYLLGYIKESVSFGDLTYDETAKGYVYSADGATVVFKIWNGKVVGYESKQHIDYGMVNNCDQTYTMMWYDVNSTEVTLPDEVAKLLK